MTMTKPVSPRGALRSAVTSDAKKRKKILDDLRKQSIKKPQMGPAGRGPTKPPR
jgi:hypothetical protein